MNPPPREAQCGAKPRDEKNRKEGRIRWVGVALAIFKEELRYEYGEGRQRALPKGCLD